MYKKYFKYAGKYYFVVPAIIVTGLWGFSNVIGDIYLK